MRVVSNTSPISNLAIVGRLPLLRYRYGQMFIPPAVANELRALSHLAAGEAISAAYKAGWLVIQTLPSPNRSEQLRQVLDAGEAEAIALATATAADLLLIDERKGRVVARSHQLKVAGVLGELLCAKFSGQVPSMRAEVEKLRREARFFIDAELESFLISQAGE